MLYRFKLTYSGEDTTVIEPMGWSEFKSEIKRDFKSHGVIFKYTSGTIKLGFADGRDVLETAFQNDGFDAVVTLTVDQRDADTDDFVNTFTGNAVMKNRELSELYFTVDFESSTFQQKVINRLNTTLRVNSALDLDGGALTPITPLTTDWGSIRFSHVYFGSASFKNEIANNVTTGNPEDEIIRYFVLEYDDTLIDTLDKKIILTSALSSGVPTYVVESAINGDLVFTSKFARNFSITVDSSVGSEDTTVQYQYLLRHSDEDDVTITTYTLYDSGITTQTEGTTKAYGNETDNVTQAITGVNTGDKFRVYCKLTGAPTLGIATVDFIAGTYSRGTIAGNNWDIKFSILKDQETFSTSYYMIYEFIDHLLSIVTGSDSKLKSDFLNRTDIGASIDGCGGLNMVTNGNMLRGLTDTPEITLNEALNSLLAIYGLGWGFEKESGNYFIRVEPMEYFYTDNEILDLGSPLSIKELDSYKETSFEPLLINNAKIGYKKFSNDEQIIGDRDDFLTVSEYSLPISTIDGQYSRISAMTTSGRLIQATFESRVDTTTAWKLDKNVFLIAASRSGGTFIPENDENFESVDGLDDKTTAYNIRLAPVYNFINHALIINSALKGKGLSELILNVSADVNKDFKATFNQYEVCLLGDSQRLQRSAVGNITIGNNYQGLRLFNPIQHTFTVAMTAAQLTLIINAMENNSDDSSKNFGYLSYKNDSSVAQKGFPLTIVWNPNDEIAEVTTLEKSDNYGI